MTEFAVGALGARKYQVMARATVGSPWRTAAECVTQGAAEEIVRALEAYRDQNKSKGPVAP